MVSDTVFVQNNFTFLHIISMSFRKRDRYPKYLYVIYEGIKPLYVGVTALPVETRFSSLYRSKYIMDNKHKLTYRVVDIIKTKEELVKEEELILHFISKGETLENKVICAGAGLPTGDSFVNTNHSRYLPRKINGDSRSVGNAKRLLLKGHTKKSSVLERPQKIQKIKDLLDSGLNLFQISKQLDMDYGNLYRFHKKYIICS